MNNILSQFFAYFIAIVLILIVLAFWLFPVGLCIYKDNWWLTAMYAFWWMPSSIFTKFISIFMEMTKENLS